MGTEGAEEKQNYKNNKGSVVLLLDPRQYSKTRFGFFNSNHSHGNFREAVLEMGEPAVGSSTLSKQLQNSHDSLLLENLCPSCTLMSFLSVFHCSVVPCNTASF